MSLLWFGMLSLFCQNHATQITCFEKSNSKQEILYSIFRLKSSRLVFFHAYNRYFCLFSCDEQSSLLLMCVTCWMHMKFYQLSYIIWLAMIHCCLPKIYSIKRWYLLMSKLMSKLGHFNIICFDLRRVGIRFDITSTVDYFGNNKRLAFEPFLTVLVRWDACFFKKIFQSIVISLLVMWLDLQLLLVMWV